MAEIRGTPSYVRSTNRVGLGQETENLRQAIEHASEVTPPEANLRIWELLETPQTLERICRVLRNEFDLPPAACTEGVKIVMMHLYREDLIQVSPDS